MLSNGMGGIDWAGLPMACAYFGVRDVDGLLLRLMVMKTYDPSAKDDDGNREAVD